MSTEENDDRYEVCFHLVGFIDLLGQQEELSRLDSLPDVDNEEEMRAFIDQLKRTFGVVDGLHKMFEEFFGGIMEKRRIPEGLKTQNPDLYKALTGSKIKFQRYSDGIVVFVALSESAGRMPFRSVWGLLSACASVMLISLASKHPLRGGLDVGIGMEMREGELYGPAVARAYNLESKVAQYPRITIGTEMVNYLLQERNLDPKDEFDSFNQEMSGLCLSLIARDIDGNTILDYLGEGFRTYVGGDPELPEQALQFAQEKLQEYREAKNTKLAIRYKLLVDYIESRLPGWETSEEPAGG